MQIQPDIFIFETYETQILFIFRRNFTHSQDSTSIALERIVNKEWIEWNYFNEKIT